MLTVRVIFGCGAQVREQKGARELCELPSGRYFFSLETNLCLGERKQGIRGKVNEGGVPYERKI